MMAYPDPDPRKTVYLTTDACDTGYGSVITQTDSNGLERPLGFHSGSFKNSQIRWEIRTKEFFAFYTSLDFFFDYLFLRKFVWRTDNQSLRYYQKNLTDRSTRKNMKLVRWLDFINQFSFTHQ